MTDLVSTANSNAMSWQVQVLTLLAGFQEGATIARLTHSLIDGTQDDESVYRRIYRALRACESSGYAQQTHRVRQFAWGEDARYGKPPICWQVTSAGANFLAAPEGHCSQPLGKDENRENTVID